MTTPTIHVQEKRKRTPLRIEEASHVIKKPSLSKQKKPRLPKPCGVTITNAPSPKIIHAKAREFKTLVQTLTGPSRPNGIVIENGKRPMNEVDHPTHESYLISDPFLGNMPFPYFGHAMPNLTDLSLSIVPNSTYLSLSPLPGYTYAETISVSTMPNIGSAVSPFTNEFLDIETINGFGF